LILNIKKQHILLILWVIFFLVVTNRLFSLYGIAYLFLDPEYLGEGGYLSFALVGIGFGAFIITWNLVLYKLNSFRFPFLATLRWPLATFAINNSIIPVAFIGTYIYCVVSYQWQYEFLHATDILLDIAGFLAGLIFMVVINAAYFQIANKDIINIIKQKRKTLRVLKREFYKKRIEKYGDLDDAEISFKVEYYLTNNFRLKRTRNVEHYDKDFLNEVFQQHHWNVVLVQIIAVATVVGLGLFIEKPFFLLPSATNIFLAFAVIISVYGLFKFWSGKWSTSAFIIAFVLINLATKYNYLSYQNKAFGLDYTHKYRTYSTDELMKLANEEDIEKDKSNTEKILNNWLVKNNKIKKPKMVFVCASGGGHRASMFTMAMLQYADSTCGGKLMKQTVLMTGASGGMLGVAYFRELYYQNYLQQNKINLNDKKYTYSLAKDLNNAITASIATNDLFYPLRSFQMKENYYKKDRGYMWEYQFNLNTNGLLNKSLKDYQIPEQKADIPLMLNYPVITNDARYLFIASQKMRYMMHPYNKNKNWENRSHIEVDGIDYLSYFKDYHPEDMPITTALRLNATYPWILPNTTFPTEPEFTTMDAGIRDNLGTGISARFISVFKNWIEENTSGIVIVEIRSLEKMEVIEEVDRKSWVSKAVSPFGTLSNNLTNLHDYNNDAWISLLKTDLKVPIEIIRFEYNPDKKSAKASMSFRLTTKEKMNIIEATKNVTNQSNAKLLKNMLK
jgi:hypothetical protein